MYRRVVLFLLLVLFPGSLRGDVVNLHYNQEYKDVQDHPSVQDERATSCVCVPPHMCQDHDKTANGEGFLDIRFDPDLEDCKNYFELCCESPLNQQVDNAVIPQENTLKGCGFEQPLGLSFRITGNGGKAQFGEAPWTIVLLLQTNDKSMYKCGGSLISHQVVLTAAHCVAGMLDEEWTIRAGEWNTRSQEEPLPHQDHKVKEIVIHPQFQSGSLKNDVALLFLEQSVTLAKNINFICLPPVGYRADDARCIASGWGKNAFKKGKHSSILKKVELPIISRSMCVDALRATRLGKFYHLDKSFICAGGEEDKDTCKGDGGSPLVCPIAGHPGRWVQVGIVSWGIGCGESNTPGVYANVALYRDWVDKQLEARGLDASLYKYE